MTAKHKEPLGKNVGGYLYWHHLLTPAQPQAVQELLLKAEQIAGVAAGKDYNVVKYAQADAPLSLLWYPDFFEDPFPSLAWSWLVDCVRRFVKKRTYADSMNPPILHRKELFLPSDHPRQAEYQALTEAAERFGLFEKSQSIGFRHEWTLLLQRRGYVLDGHQLVFTQELKSTDPELGSHSFEASRAIHRHRTALTRYNLSKPMQVLARFGFLDGEKTVFDYGCGKGDDVRNLAANGIVSTGWDPYFAPDQPKHPAQIVNMGFVINVIEQPQDRVRAMLEAFSLAQELLVVSAMLYNQNAPSGLQYQDGIVTARSTFQKYYTQAELKNFLQEALQTQPIAVGPGIFFIFSDADAEQRFLSDRQRSQSNLLRLVRPEKMQPQSSVRILRREMRLAAIINLKEKWLEFGRAPHKSEIGLKESEELLAHFGTFAKAVRFLQEETEPQLLEQAKQNRVEDLRVYFAMHAFRHCRPYSHLEDSLQRDIKAFFGGYAEALEQGRKLLFRVADQKAIESDCQKAAEQGIGYDDQAGALFVPSSEVERLSPLLRAYIGCAAMLYGDILSADLIKIHIETSKLSLMRYDDFWGAPLPRLLERVKINFRTQDFDYFQYGVEYEPTYLYLKSRYLNEDSISYAEQLQFDEALQSLGLFDFSGYGPKPHQLREILAKARWEIQGRQLVRSQAIPCLDEPCGKYFTYRDLIECGETWQRTKIENIPQQPDSYTALYDLAVTILDPVVERFGKMCLTYCFCSAALAREIRSLAKAEKRHSRIEPALDQHAAHELNRLGKPICSRLGAAVDFVIENQNMLEVAEWVAQNTQFDRLYFYGPFRSFHVSHGPENKKEFIEMRLGKQGRLYPYKRRA